MPTFLRSAIGATLLTAMVGCQQKPHVAEMDVCEAVQSAPELLDKPVVISGWYGNAYHWAGVGSKECEDVVEVRFEEGAPLSFNGPEEVAAQQARHAIAEKFYPLWDFHGRFHGVLTQRAVRHPMSPSLDEIRYLLTVQKVDDIKIERAAWKSTPPASPPN